MGTQTMIDASTTTVTGRAFSIDDSPKVTFQAFGTTSAGTGAASVNIYVSNTPNVFNATPAGNITLTLGTTSTADGFVLDGNWSYARADIASISGTGAAVTVLLGN